MNRGTEQGWLAGGLVLCDIYWARLSIFGKTRTVTDIIVYYYNILFQSIIISYTVHTVFTRPKNVCEYNVKK